MATSSLGPTLSATVVTPDLDLSISAWCGHLYQQVFSRGTISGESAGQWGYPALAGAQEAWLANELGEPWLRLIGLESAPVTDPFHHRGWMSLEINVEDVDGLRPGLEQSPFRIIGEPANLDVSDDIRAMQAVGPAGEVLYLTEVKAEVPPFELPFARCTVDRLFIPVLLAPDRDSSLAVYEQFPGTEGLCFETRITVINRARRLDIESRHPVATIQLHGSHLIEIDQLDSLAERPALEGCPPAGIALISLAIDSLPASLPQQVLADGPHSGRRSALIRGAAGEWIELIETP